MRIQVVNTLDDLASDCAKVAKGTRPGMVKVVREGIKTGNVLARDNARRSAGKHGKHYPRSFTAEIKFNGIGAVVGEYGPVADRKQGGMSFEEGSRNQRPHRDLAKSLDVIAPAFRGEVRNFAAGLFWPGGDG